MHRVERRQEAFTLRWFSVCFCFLGFSVSGSELSEFRESLDFGPRGLGGLGFGFRV